MKIGLAGIGRMGMVLAERMLAAGVDLTLWNRSVERVTSLGAIAVADSPRALAGSCDVVLSIISGDDANLAVYTADDGLLSAPAPRLFVNLSTLSPKMMRKLAAASHAAGHDFVEAPILGTVVPAKRGELVVLAGGDPSTIDRLALVFATFSRKVVCMGDIGNGTVMKMVHNLMLSLYWRAAGEALAFGAASGLSLTDMVPVISDSFAANRQWPLKEALLRGQDAPVGFDIAGLAAETKLQEKLLDDIGVSHQMLSLTRTAADAAVADGWGTRDVAALALYLANGRSASRSD